MGRQAVSAEDRRLVWPTSRPTRPTLRVSSSCRSTATRPPASASIRLPWTTRSMIHSPAACRPAVHDAQHLLRDPGGRSVVPARPLCTQPHLYPFVRGDHGAAQPDREHRLRHRAAFRELSEPVPVGDAELQPGAGHGGGTAVAAVQKATAELHVPSTVVTSFQGNAQAFQAALASTPD